MGFFSRKERSQQPPVPGLKQWQVGVDVIFGRAAPRRSALCSKRSRSDVFGTERHLRMVCAKVWELMGKY